MKKIGTIVFGLILLTALIATVLLTGKNQDTRKSAYFAGSRLFLLPGTTTVTQNQVFPVELWVETGNVTGGSGRAQVVAVTTYVCYDDTKVLVDGSLTTAVTPNRETSSFNEVPLALAATAGTGFPTGVNKCVNLSVTSNKPQTELSSGTVKVAKIMFKAVASGTTGQIVLDKSKSVVSGYTTTTDTSMSIDSVTGLAYTITGGSAPTPTSPVATAVPTEPVPTETEPTPTNTPPVTTGDWPILNYMISFRDVRANYKCISDWPVTVTALAPDGTTKIYADQVPMVDASITNRVAYRGGLVLEDFPYYDNVAIFFKGPKHLQTKYGMDNQTDYYPTAGGDLTLTADPETSPVYDFSGYPLMPGDVTGPTAEVPDGIVDGRDYSYIKAASTRRDRVADGGYLQADLDGSCQADGMDTVFFKMTLQDKLDQLY